MIDTATGDVPLNALHACRLPRLAMLLLATLIPSSVNAGRGADLPGQKPEPIVPGTVIDAAPPEGWSHLVLKGCSRAAAGDLKDVPQKHLAISSRFGTAFLADVQQAPDGRYHLAKVGFGVTTAIDDRDVVITPKTHRKLGAGLTMMERFTLDGFYERQMRIRVIFQDDQMALIDAPTTVRFEDQNRILTLRYGLFVEPETGTLAKFVWLVVPSKAEDPPQVGSSVQQLAENAHNRARLYVDKRHYSLGIPSAEAYAIMEVPTGQALELEPPAWLATPIPDAELAVRIRRLLVPPSATQAARAAAAPTR